MSAADLKGIQERRRQIAEEVARLQAEDKELEIALRVFGRYASSSEAAVNGLAQGRLGPSRPEDTPSLFDDQYRDQDGYRRRQAGSDGARNRDRNRETLLAGGPASANSSAHLWVYQEGAASKERQRHLQAGERIGGVTTPIELLGAFAITPQKGAPGGRLWTGHPGEQP